MARSLVIVESPAKAKTINRYLGKDFIVKSSVGHIRDLPVGAKAVDPKARAKEAQKTKANVVIFVNSSVANRVVESVKKMIVIVAMNNSIIIAEERIKSKYEPAAHVFEYFEETPMRIATNSRI